MVPSRRVDLLDTDDNTVLLYEREDGTTAKCVRPSGFSGQFSRDKIDNLETNGSHTDYIISINDELVTVESIYKKAKDTTIDIPVSIDEHGVDATKETIELRIMSSEASLTHVFLSVIPNLTAVDLG